MTISARAREISIWDTVGMTVRLAIATRNPDACGLAYAVLAEQFGDDVDLRQSFIHALAVHVAVLPDMLPYEHLARAYVALHAAGGGREFDVDILMGTSGAAPADRSRVRACLHDGHGIPAIVLAALFVLAAGFDGEDAEYKLRKLAGTEALHAPGRISYGAGREGVGGPFTASSVLRGRDMASAA